ncbi:hypothetical protein BDV06DRAFT_125449 [Aspergillus oleicola]
MKLNASHRPAVHSLFAAGIFFSSVHLPLAFRAQMNRLDLRALSCRYLDATSASCLLANETPRTLACNEPRPQHYLPRNQVAVGLIPDQGRISYAGREFDLDSRRSCGSINFCPLTSTS